jgi:hypothetical protein
MDMLLDGLAALAGQIIGTTLSPEIPAAAFLVVLFAQSWGWLAIWIAAGSSAVIPDAAWVRRRLSGDGRR